MLSSGVSWPLPSLSYGGLWCAGRASNLPAIALRFPGVEFTNGDGPGERYMALLALQENRRPQASQGGSMARPARTLHLPLHADLLLLAQRRRRLLRQTHK